MARRWTPRRLIVMRRARIIACVLSISLTATSLFIFTAKKSVAMIINGKTHIVSTYSTNPIRLLEEQHVPVKTHDQIISSSGDILTNHSTVTVRSAYQTSITVDGVTIPFWTVATSVDQLIGFFKANAKNASRITVNLQNIYDKLTCGLSINKKGPISVIADRKTRIVQNGDLPASAILDSQGIVLGKEDRVSVEEDDGNTVLRVSRVTHGKETRTVSLPFATQTVVDPKLPANSRVVQQVGVNGEREDVYNVTYVDGKAESATLVSQNLVKPAVNQVIAVGKAAPAPIHKNNTNTQKSKQSKQQTNAQHKKQNTEQPAKQEKKNSQQQTQQQTASAAPAPAANPPAPAPSSNPDSLVHATPEQAKLFAQGAAAQMGWTGKEWEDLLWLWNRESGWRWNAENPSSHAYGIPQALPGNKMSSAGANWHEDAAIQISWGLSYIKSKYKTPSGAVKHSREIGWY
ncbi:G5 domain-containing protein [Gardnerella swidsinskii]|uniref:aggregation-promoting factor C-terminal-like domain-containing protein n=1 Tax=Gardnerella TaxID=2701 RepID=UPI000E34A452|nr:G5 domain-containing protein [Gardnerella swidsinskii]NSX39912.1 G5 domain-containing protein [Gardnerella vaginalis]RFT32814.1 G5 domain-containing protein [Bifidobacteriaceae bacterium NR020]RIY29091.1 G5 domain-containing protein [Bifidobacteriaceae bacterium NR016]MDK6295577.1 G5 domain-containing protein [Gardnerella swidsinskii]MDK7092617.1 G5 domain-containing protein [Gardnerella swidsinskii]